MSEIPVGDLEQKIEQTRKALAETLRDLEFRLSPGKQASVAWRITKEKAAITARTTANWASENPVPTALIVLGLAGFVYLAAFGRPRRPND